jgi:hypothetical protein
MPSQYQFHIVEVNGLFTVICTMDGIIQGGDHHWLQRSKAEQALQIYTDNPNLHGATPSELGLE